jgi:hypothetical protein
MGHRIIKHFGDEWVIDNDTGHSLVVSDLDDLTTKIVRKKHDEHFEICVEAA